MRVNKVLKICLLSFLATAGLAPAQDSEIAEFFGAKRLPYPSESDVLGIMSAFKKEGFYSFIGTPVVYKYDLAKIMQIVPEQHRDLVRQNDCNGRDNDIYVVYDKVESNKRVSFRYLCTNVCVAVIEKVGRPNSKGFKPTKELSPAVSVDEKLCQIFTKNSGVSIIDKTKQSIVD